MVFIFKIVLVLLLLFVITNLVRALFEMVKGSDNTEGQQRDQPPMSHYLGKRVILSALAVILMLVALLSGLIEPNPRPF